MIKVLGGGEVGVSIYGLLRENRDNRWDVLLQDLDFFKRDGKRYKRVEGMYVDSDLEDFVKYKILHVCIPWSDKFVDVVVGEIERNAELELVIIHSTVKVGTTEEINKRIGRMVCVHSPVRGIHPNLVEGLRTFVKYVGADDDTLFRRAIVHLERMGIEIVEDGGGSRDTEMAKIMSTTYYGWNIIFEKEMKRLCDREGLDFDLVYSDWNKTYNEGYRKLGMGHVVRPVLEDMPGKIGGHCITPNCKLIDTFLTRTILARDETF